MLRVHRDRLWARSAEAPGLHGTGRAELLGTLLVLALVLARR